MRITLLLLAAGLGVAASGTAAAAEAARGSMVRSGGTHVGVKPFGWGLGFNTWQPRRHHPGRGHGRPWHHGGHDRPGHGHDRPGHHDGHDRPGHGHDRPGHHDGHGDHDGWGGHWDRDRDDLYPYGAGGFAGPYEAVDPYGTGFFAGAGGAVRVRGGRPQFDYDRSYPYEWASAAGGRPQREAREVRYAAPPPGRCAMENGVRVCRGW
jgi:hypothetical protein